MKFIKISAVWCPSCIIMNNVINKLKKEYEDLEIVNYDYDMDEDIVKKYDVGKILPVMIIEKNEKEIDRIIGEKSVKELENFIKRYLDEENN